VLSLLIVVSVIRGAAAAGPIRIGILKVLGFSPGQVTAAYAGPGLAPAARAAKTPAASALRTG
jgi:putative ABC transport system permease protein